MLSIRDPLQSYRHIQTESERMEKDIPFKWKSKESWTGHSCIRTGCLGLVHWDDPERWYGERGGRGVQYWEHMYTCGGFMLMYAKTNTIL